mmetsp:Transcript_70186/g.196712  ORF Transcript_70186/g.196712 Transcript_70186/m.196712 type:complete len:116 (+) Transcript_70186:168-515(+)
MGNFESRFSHSSNDFELCIRSSKELEHLLDTEFGASGKGLHEKITSCENHLTPDMVKHMRYLATIRNKLVHEHDFNKIPDRAKFIKNFEQSAKELKEILKKRNAGKNGGDQCVIS